MIGYFRVGSFCKMGWNVAGSRADEHFYICFKKCAIKAEESAGFYRTNQITEDSFITYCSIWSSEIFHTRGLQNHTLPVLLTLNGKKDNDPHLCSHSPASYLTSAAVQHQTSGGVSSSPVITATNTSCPSCSAGDRRTCALSTVGKKPADRLACRRSLI